MVNFLVIQQLVNVVVIVVIQTGKEILVKFVEQHAHRDQVLLIVIQQLVDVQVHSKHWLLLVLSVILLRVDLMVVLMHKPVHDVYVTQTIAVPIAQSVIGSVPMMEL